MTERQVKTMSIPMTVKTEFGTYEDCRLSVGRYFDDDTLCIRIYNAKDGPIATITKCLREPHWRAEKAYVDTNNCPWAPAFISEYKLGKPTGKRKRSGYCTYPQYEFDRKVLGEFV